MGSLISSSSAHSRLSFREDGPNLVPFANGCPTSYFSLVLPPPSRPKNCHLVKNMSKFSMESYFSPSAHLRLSFREDGPDPKIQFGVVALPLRDEGSEQLQICS